MNKISVVISAYNEGKNIKDCLNSVKDFADELIVVDNSSQDQTGQIARELGAKVYEQKNDPTKVDLQKNFGFEKATSEWILSLDADERVPEDLSKEIEERVKNQDTVFDGFWIPRKNIIFGKWVKSDMWWPDYQLRIFRKGKGKFGKNSVHTALTVDGETDKLTKPLLHENYQTVSQFVSRLNLYTDMEAENLADDGYRFNWLDAIRFPTDDFVKTFFLQKGYSQGLHGLVLSMLQAFYMEVVFAKLWEKRKFEEIESSNFLVEVVSELANSANKIKYWFSDAMISSSTNPIKKILHKTTRKISNSKIKK